MTKLNFGKLAMILTAVFLLGFSAEAMAGPGMGYGRGMGYGYGMGEGPGMGYGRGMGWGRGMGYGRGPGRGFWGYDAVAGLSDEQIQKLEDQRKAFFEATDDLRKDLFAKQLELRSEFAKKSPDANKAAELQKDISRLRSQLDQKRIEHRLEMQKINPDLGRGPGRGFGRWGRGAGYGGPCWR